MNGYDTVMRLGCDCGCNGSQPVQPLSGVTSEILFNSTPDTPDTWSCTNWMTWHKKLVQAFKDGKFASGIKYPDTQAKELANQVFMQWWEKLADGFLDSRQFCGYDTDFFNYFKSVGLTDHISFVAGILTPVTGAVTSVASGAQDVTENVVDTTKGTTGTLKWLVPTLLVTAVIGVGLYVHKNYIKGNRSVRVGPAKI